MTNHVTPLAAFPPHADCFPVYCEPRMPCQRHAPLPADDVPRDEREEGSSWIDKM